MLLVSRHSCVFLCFLAGSAAFLPSGTSSRRIRLPKGDDECDYSLLPSCGRLWSSLEETEGLKTSNTAQVLYKKTDALTDAVHALCRMGELEGAMKLIHSVEDSLDSAKPDQATYAAVMNAYARSDREDAVEKVDEILSSMSHEYCTPKGQAYSAVILAWSNSRRPHAAERADALLNELWSLYDRTQDQAYLPTRATYTSVITAWARSDQCKEAAERAEELLEDMEAYYRDGYTLLGPTTACVNAVL